MAEDEPALTPLAALEEIAFLLERERASRYRSKAFRAAAAAITGLTDAQLRDTASLRRRKGIGDSTFAVIQQALEGQVPGYLVQLREAAGVEAPTAGAGLRRKLRGDLHSHSEWSDGLTPIDQMVEAATALGHEYLALTDHSPRLRVANGLSVERLQAQRKVVAGINASGSAGFTLLSGIEVDILEDGALDQTPEMLEALDVVVASAHSKLRMERGPMTRRLVAAASDPHVDVLGHVTGRLVEGSRGTRPQSTFDAHAVFEACAAHGVAVEINSRPERQDPPDDLLAMAIRLGCLFSIDSDAHAPGQLSLIDHGAARAVKLGVPPERIVTTWTLERLLAWTGRARDAGGSEGF